MSQTSPHYAFSYFTQEGETGVHLALSRDGINWQAVADGKSLFRAEVGDENLMRDPFVIPASDGSGFHCLWTTGWRGKTIGYAFSPDLMEWSDIRALPVLEEIPDGRNAWAPEVTFDPETGDYLIYFSVMQPSHYEGHRMYCVRTKDFKTISKATVFYDPGFSVIDAHLIPDPSRNRWCMIVKDEGEGQKHLFSAHAPTLEGPWTIGTKPIAGDLTEGATSFATDKGWTIIYDAYGDHEYRALQSEDLDHFAPLEETLNLPGRVRHGTVFPISEETYQKLSQLD